MTASEAFAASGAASMKRFLVQLSGCKGVGAVPDKLRTKRDILEALIELTEEVSFEQVTVKAICERAHVSRQTFYSYFKDKYDTALWLIEPLIGESFLRLGRDLGWRDAYLRLFKAIEKNPWGLMRVVQSNDRNSIQNTTIRTSRRDFTEAYVSRYGNEPPCRIAYQIERFSITASLATDDWVLSGCAVPAEAFVDDFVSLIPRDLFEALDVSDVEDSTLV